jgi:integrase
MFFSVNYYLDKAYKQKTDKAIIKKHIFDRKVNQKHLNLHKTSIYLWVSMLSKKTKVRTIWKIEPIHWDFKKQKIKKSYPNYSQANIHLDRLKLKVEKALMEALNKEMITIEELQLVIKDTVNNKVINVKAKDFLSAFDEFLDEKKQEVNTETMKKFNTFKKVIYNFKKEKGYVLIFSNINKNFHNAFLKYLAEERQLLDSTSSKYYQILNTFLNSCVKKGYTNNLAYKDFENPKYDSDPIILEEFELDKLKELDLSQNINLEAVRDYFIFACSYGQRYSDIKGFSIHELVTIEGDLFWSLWQRKGQKKKKIFLPILKEAESLINKYIDGADKRSGKIFPVLSNQKTNKNIKIICKMAGITDNVHQVKYRNKKRIETNRPKWEHITCHTARRTFTTLSMDKGYQDDYLRETTGHKDHKTLDLYKNPRSNQAIKEFIRIWGNDEDKLRIK